MKKITVLFTRSPHSTPHGREGLDFAMLSASFDQQVSLIFIDEGILNLLKDQQPMLTGNRDYIATFKVLPLYDVEDIFVCQQDLALLQLNQQDLLIDVELINDHAIQQKLADTDEVLVF